MVFSPFFTVTNSRGTRDPVALNDEACLMRYGVENNSNPAQLENLSGLFRWTPPVITFLSSGNKTLVSIWFIAILWDLCS